MPIGTTMTRNGSEPNTMPTSWAMICLRKWNGRTRSNATSPLSTRSWIVQAVIVGRNQPPIAAIVRYTSKVCAAMPSTSSRPA